MMFSVKRGLLAISLTHILLASGSEWRLSQLSRKVWQIEDGLPHNYVNAIATDGKGYLLIGTQSGITRFDGMHFTPFERLGGMWIYSLLRSSDGAVWAGGYQSGLHMMRDGKVQSWFASDGIGQGTVFSMLEDRSHQIWAVSPEALLRFDRGTPVQVVRGNDVDGFAWQSMTEDDTGSIWFAARQGLFQVTAGKATTMRLNGTQGFPVTVYYSSAQRQLYLGTTTALYLLNCRTDTCDSRKIPDVQGPVVGLRVSSDGALWAATWGNGVYRSEGGRVEQLSTRQGLADDFVRVLFEDSERNLWAGTRSGGLTRFRQTILKPVGIPEGLGGNYASAVIGDGADGLWLGTWRSGLFHWRNGVMTSQALPEPSLGLLINALAVDDRKDLWVGSFNGLLRVRFGSATAERVPLPENSNNVTNLLWARDRTLWLAKQGTGLMGFRSGDPNTSRAEIFLNGQTLTALLEDGQGRIWAGTKTGLWRIGGAPDRKVEKLAGRYVTAAGLDSQGRVWIAEAGNNIQVYTNAGPVRLHHSGLPASAIYIIAADARDDIWFGTGRGLARASMADVEAFLSGHLSSVSLVTHGVSEGMRTIECRIGAQPSSWKLPDGSVWLPTAKGFVEIGPVPTEPIDPPRPLGDTVQIDGKTVNGAARLSPGAHELVVSFTAIRLGRAEGVQFRYRMQGLDQDWVEAGDERIVRFGHLPPGHFQLMVSARDPAGAWSDAASSITIEQLPFMYQTLWFRSLLAIALVLLTVAIYRLRLHAVRKRYQAVIEERNRIAREWHDTLLAGLSAASWQLDVAAEQCRQSPAFASIRSAGGMVRYCRDEARRAVGDLRDKPHIEISLADSLRQSIGQLTEGTSLRSRFEIEGKLPACSSELRSDLLRICQEATANALQHARARELVVRLDSSDGKISLSVEDDGIGMDTALIDHRHQGHYGLLGMQERARRFGGVLYLSSEPGHGTKVRAVVPLQS